MTKSYLHKSFLLLFLLCSFVPLHAQDEEEEEEYETESKDKKPIDVYWNYTLLYLDGGIYPARKVSYTKTIPGEHTDITSKLYCAEMALLTVGRLYRIHYKELKGKTFRTLSFNVHPTIKISMVGSIVGFRNVATGYGSFQLPVTWNINSRTSARTDGRVVSGKTARNGFSYGIGFQLGILPLIFESRPDYWKVPRTISLIPMINTERTRYKNGSLGILGFQMGYFLQTFKHTEINPYPSQNQQALYQTAVKHHCLLFRMYYGGFVKTRYRYVKKDPG